ncbi:MAG: exo-alpha-sialidase [Methylococcaceae bacterium]|nr:exo-alpha-sialidase [Methylococcaceae bacterium]
MKHKHSKPSCKDASMLPKIECAETVTSTFDRHGKLWTVWTRSGHLYLQSSTDKGQTFSPAVTVNRTPEDVRARGENRPKIKIDGDDNIYLTWTNSLGKRFTSNIRFTRSTDGGKSFSEPVTINDDNKIIGHAFDSLAIGQDGEVFITWLDSRDTHAAKDKGEEYIGSSLYYSWSDDNGESFTANKKIGSHTCQCCRLQTAIDKDNTPVVVWRHIFEGGIRDHALIKFKDWDTAGEVTRISHENWKIDACPHHGTGLSIAKEGRYHSVWFSNSETHQGLFYGYSVDEGKTFSAPINFAKQGAGNPHVLAIGEKVYIAWQQFDGTNTLAKLMRSTDAGVTWSEAETITQVASDKVDRPFLIEDANQAYLSWQVPNQNYQLKAIY